MILVYMRGRFPREGCTLLLRELKSRLAAVRGFSSIYLSWISTEVKTHILR